MTQLTQSRDPVHGLPGQIADARPHDITSHVAEGSTLAPGLYVISGTAQGDAKVPTAAFTTAGLGVVHESATEYLASSVITDNDVIGVVRKGVVLVAYEADTAPTPNTPAYARHTANGAGKLTLGAIRANADSANASVIPGGMFRNVFTADGLAELELSGHVAS